MATACTQRRILVKCGGFASQLATRVGDEIDGDPLWGSRFDAKNPTAVIQTHLDFLNNGAQIILSNTYQSSVEGFMKYLNCTYNESIQLIRKSVQLAKQARTTFLKTTTCADNDLPLVMASIGPYGAHLHDASEYSGSYADKVSKEEIQEWHRIRIDACLEEGVDGLALETIPCQMEAEALVDMLLRDYPKIKFWVSFQCKDEEHLAHGENFADAVLSIWHKVLEKKATDRLYAIGVNCLNPKFVTPLFRAIHTLPDGDLIPLIVYSNRGETYDAAVGKWIGREDCVPLENYLPEWLKLGVVIVGGCCRVYAADIARIRTVIDNLTNKKNQN